MDRAALQRETPMHVTRRPAATVWTAALCVASLAACHGKTAAITQSAAIGAAQRFTTAEDRPASDDLKPSPQTPESTNPVPSHSPSQGAADGVDVITAWSLVGVQDGGKRLDIGYESGEGCETFEYISVTETPSTVTLTPHSWYTPPAGPGQACGAAFHYDYGSVELHDALGSRTLHHPATTRPVLVNSSAPTAAPQS
jgi:hypothetical protein